MLDRVKDSLVYEKDKLHRDDGNNSFGDLLTGTMNRLGFKHLQSYLNDKLISIYPPYDTPEQQAAINMFLRPGDYPRPTGTLFKKTTRKRFQARGTCIFWRNFSRFLRTTSICSKT